MGASRTQGYLKNLPHCPNLERSRSPQKLGHCQGRTKTVLILPCDGTRTTIRHSLGPLLALLGFRECFQVDHGFIDEDSRKFFSFISAAALVGIIWKLKASVPVWYSQPLVIGFTAAFYSYPFSRFRFFSVFSFFLVAVCVCSFCVSFLFFNPKN